MTDRGGNRPGRRSRIITARQALAAKNVETPVERYEARMARLAAAGARQVPAGDWCILRTAGASTIALERSLAAAGFEVWTPVEMQSRRRSRSIERIQREVPIMPSFLFVGADRLADLVIIGMRPAGQHPPFSILHDAGRIPLVADREIEALRGIERAKGRAWLGQRAADRRGAQRHQLPVGSIVKVTEGGFAGLSGKVTGGNKAWAAIDFGGNNVVHISTWLIGTDAIQVDAD